MHSNVYRLVGKREWNTTADLPQVSVTCRSDESSLRFAFDVREPEECFRLSCHHDGERCWEDSCVEVFIGAPRMNGYFNFETNAAGVTLAEFGRDRFSRLPFETKEYRSLRRSVLVAPHIASPGRIHWSVDIEIPLEILEMQPLDPIVGNLYKCGSKAAQPHYLSAFPIDVSTPDFHRPEFFRRIFS